MDTHTGTPIDPPEDFPVEWSAPEQAQMPWQRDPMHSPNQTLPLEQDVWELVYGRGFLTAARAYEMPIGDVAVARIHTWHYEAMMPSVGSPEEMQKRGERAEAALRAAIGRLREMWEDELLPEIRRHLDDWASVDLAALSLPELAAHVEESWERFGRLWEIHFLTVFPAYIAVSEFDETCRDLFPSDGPFAAYRLIQGHPNKTVESGQALWRLSRRAMASREVLELLEREAAAAVPAALRRSEEGRGFLADLGSYLQRYGQRSDLWSVTTPSWIEDPTPVIKNLKDFVTRPDSEAPAVTTRQAAEEAERLIAQARARLQGYPVAVQEQFEQMLSAAAFGLVLTEDHGFYIDFRGSYGMRRVLMEAGRRLAARGSIHRPDDVFMLRRVELAEALHSEAGDLQPLIAERATELVRWRDITPPRQLGILPAGPPPENPMLRAMAKLFGTPPPESEAPNELRGAPGSAGTVRGPARVIRSIADAERLKPGDVLVAETTAPPWTPLFASAAAVVTDTGGVLSHCAVVAREYAIPAVVGTGNATSAVRDGDILEVDGDAGIVRIG